MIAFEPEHLRELVAAAEAAYPEEACGLLVGVAEASRQWRVARVAPSPNLAADQHHRFEIDPKLRLDLHRTLRGGPHRVIGLYHSHPDESARPSAADLEQAWEPELVWVITSVLDCEAVLTTGHVLVHDGETTRFEEISVRTTDWGPYVSRDRITGPSLG